MSADATQFYVTSTDTAQLTHSPKISEMLLTMVAAIKLDNICTFLICLWYTAR